MGGVKGRRLDAKRGPSVPKGGRNGLNDNEEALKGNEKALKGEEGSLVCDGTR